MATNKNHIDLVERIRNLNIFTSPETHRLINTELKRVESSPISDARSFATDIDRIAFVLFLFHDKKECTMDKIKEVDRSIFRLKNHGEAPITGSKLRSGVLPSLLLAVYNTIKKKDGSPIDFAALLDETNDKQEEEVKKFLEDFRVVIQGAVELGARTIYKELIPDKNNSDPVPFFKSVRMKNKDLEDEINS